MGGRTETTVNAELGEAAQVAAAVEAFATAHGLSNRDWTHLDLLLEELFVNIVKHGTDPAAPAALGPIKLTLSADDASITAELIDQGQPFNPINHPLPETQRPLEERQVGGLGLYFVAVLSDAVKYRRENGQNIVTLTFNRSSE